MNADQILPLIFGRLTLEALPLHEPILVVTMIVVALGGVALLGGLAGIIALAGLKRLSADKPFERGDPCLIGLDRVGGGCIVVERASLVFLHPDAQEVARGVMALGQAEQRLARRVLLYDLALECDAVGTMSVHGLHPPKTQ